MKQALLIFAAIRALFIAFLTVAKERATSNVGSEEIQTRVEPKLPLRKVKKI